MPDKPGAQFRDHPNMADGRDALPAARNEYIQGRLGVGCPMLRHCEADSAGRGL
jgi:hypothetical protein